ncbi:hypothetical protein BGX23_003055 [Mortierella sp. AD031]|nr:hypothetical protein BGX23_003055 [Mortierella sp. AD031]
MPGRVNTLPTSQSNATRAKYMNMNVTQQSVRADAQRNTPDNPALFLINQIESIAEGQAQNHPQAAPQVSPGQNGPGQDHNQGP